MTGADCNISVLSIHGNLFVHPGSVNMHGLITQGPRSIKNIVWQRQASSSYPVISITCFICIRSSSFLRFTVTKIIFSLNWYVFSRAVTHFSLETHNGTALFMASYLERRPYTSPKRCFFLSYGILFEKVSFAHLKKLHIENNSGKHVQIHLQLLSSIMMNYFCMTPSQMSIEEHQT